MRVASGVLRLGTAPSAPGQTQASHTLASNVLLASVVLPYHTTPAIRLFFVHWDAELDAAVVQTLQPPTPPESG